MKIVRLALLAAGFMLACLSSAQDVDVAVPKLQPHVNVYCIPEGQLPDGVTSDDITRLQSTIDGLHMKPVIILMDQLPNSVDNNTKGAHTVTTFIRNTWINRYPALFNKMRDSVYLVSFYKPRQCILIPPVLAREKLGLENDDEDSGDGKTAVTDFLQEHFLPEASDGDIPGGLVTTMKALDEQLFDATDPQRIAQRAAEEKQRAAEEALQDSRAALNENIQRLRDLLSDPRYLPANVSAYQTALNKAEPVMDSGNLSQLHKATATLAPYVEKLQNLVSAREEEVAEQEAAQGALDTAISGIDNLLAKPAKVLPSDTSLYEQAVRKARDVRKRNDKAEMSVEAKNLEVTLKSLKAFVSDREEEQRREQQKATLIFFSLAVAAIALLALVVWRLFAVIDQRAKVLKKIRGFRQKLEVYDRQFATVFSANSWDALKLLQAKEGETKVLLDQTLPSLNRVVTAIEGALAYADDCKDTASTAGFFSLAPLKKAEDMLVAKFDFTTKPVLQQLFGDIQEPVQYTLSEACTVLAQEYDTTIQNCKTLLSSLEATMALPEDQFKGIVLEQVYSAADLREIPHRWFSNHPLSGDDEADRQLYTTLHNLQDKDPVAFLRTMHELKERETQVVNVLRRLVTAQDLATSERIETLSPLSTVLDASDDPQQTLQRARSEERKFAGLLASATTVEEVEDQAKRVQEAYQLTAGQQASAEKAIEQVEGLIGQAKDAENGTNLLKEETFQKLESARSIHKFIQGAQEAFTSGASQLTAGLSFLSQASDLVKERRHLNAEVNAQKSLESIKQAQSEFERCQAILTDLDAEKRKFEEKLAEMEDLRDRAKRRIRNADGSQRLAAYVEPSPDGVSDYAALLLTLTMQEQAWNRQAQAAETAYEAAQAAERAAEQSRRASQWSSSSSNDSSSSFNFGGGGGGGVSISGGDGGGGVSIGGGDGGGGVSGF